MTDTQPLIEQTILPDPPAGPPSGPPGGRARRVAAAIIAAARRIPEGSAIFARWLMVVTILVVGTSLFMQRYQVPFYYLAPGPPTDVLASIQVRGAPTYPSVGKLLLTTASVGQQRMNLWDVLSVWIDANAIAIPEEDLGRGGQTDAEVQAEGVSDMESSKINAELAAFKALGFDVPVQSGAYVLATFGGSGAADVLQTGDVIVRIAGRAVTNGAMIRQALRDARLGDRVEVEFIRNDKRVTKTVTLKTKRRDADVPALGVEVGRVYRFPHRVEIDTQRIIGPSGGLVFALSLADVLMEEDLTRGHTVAVTGTIGPTRYFPKLPADGVGPIGAIEEKVRGARAIGADVFVVPKEQEAAARAEAPEGMTVIGVRTLGEAIKALRALPLKA